MTDKSLSKRDDLCLLWHIASYMWKRSRIGQCLQFMSIVPRPSHVSVRRSRQTRPNNQKHGINYKTEKAHRYSSRHLIISFITPEKELVHFNDCIHCATITLRFFLCITSFIASTTLAASRAQEVSAEAACTVAIQMRFTDACEQNCQQWCKSHSVRFLHMA